MVLKAGVDVNSKDSEGWTIFHYASREKNYELAKYLCDNTDIEQDAVYSEEIYLNKELE